MSKWGTIKEIAYGSFDQKLSARQKRNYGFVGLMIAVSAQFVLAKLLIPPNGAITQIPIALWLSIPNKALLNIIVFPFQLVGIISLIYIVQSVTEGKYPFGKYSFWHLGTENYIPLLIRARAFMYYPFVIIIAISEYLGVYMDYTTQYKHFYFWLVFHNVVIILAIFVLGWLKIFLEKFEAAIGSVINLLPKESKSSDEQSIRKHVFSHKELAFIAIIFLLAKLLDVVIDPHATWLGGREYKFPLTAIWAAFSIYIIAWSIFALGGSLAYIYSRVGWALKNFKNQILNNIFLFHPDGYVGLGKINDFIFYFSTKILSLVAIFTFVNFLVIHFDLVTDPSLGQKGVITGTIIADLIVFIVILYPLIEIRSVIKRKKEVEREQLFERIKDKEKAYLERSIKSEEFQEIENIFKLIKRINAVPEWGLVSQQRFSLLGKFLLTFNGLALQLLTKYLGISSLFISIKSIF